MRLFSALIRQSIWYSQRAGLRGPGLRAGANLTANQNETEANQDVQNQRTDQTHQDDAGGGLASIKNISKPIKRGDIQAALARLDSITKEDIAGVGKGCDDVDPLSEDLDTEYLDSLAPELPKMTFNMAAIINEHKPLQRLAQLGVDLSAVEKRSRRASEAFIRIQNFDNEIGPYLQWLVSDVGIPSKGLGEWITAYPLVIKEDIDNLKTRIEYLRVKQFKENQIRTILRRCPRWLSRHTQEVDSKLGFLQREFEFLAQELRLFVTSYPQIILTPTGKITQTKFSLLEEMGFTALETRKILMLIPTIFEAEWKPLLRNFDLIHNESGVPHSHIVRMPHFLTSPHRQLSDRVEYLQKLKKLQLDPTKPLYIPLDALDCNRTTDADFAARYARTSLDDFNLFLRHI